ncbi:MAG: hypothetical protein AAF223_13000 [Bacteroidota bacterium]
MFLVGWLLLIGCQQDDDAEPTLEQQLAGQWQLDNLQATIELDSTDYKIFLAQLADSFGLAPAEIAIGLILLEGQITQGLLDREPILNLHSDNSFDFQQIDSNPLLGSWQLSEDQQQFTLTSEAGEEMLFTITSVDESRMALLMQQASSALIQLPQFPQQLNIQLEMDWLAQESFNNE